MYTINTELEQVTLSEYIDYFHRTKVYIHQFLNNLVVPGGTNFNDYATVLNSQSNQTRSPSLGWGKVERRYWRQGLRGHLGRISKGICTKARVFWWDVDSFQEGKDSRW
ncbi:hypothetical protein RF11_09756 [Thelohanellus kitauei]|uniref:Uncharacterized protein n=1 Tax=Thelohanellus kitauei TaxID=669202 RepID=A0A0C2MRP5_THEKT|nr:hypothetical protein RF11_09756 [Thelohanellus kitauei]